ncbi:MAG: twin-arginine translocase TatA/TatE family subunit [Nitrosopumilaceae archaeon]
MGFENIFLQLPMGNEWIILIIIAVVLIFGAKKIPELAKTFGKAKGEFEKGKIEGEKELKDFKDKEVKSD